jgi:Holliday junction resolvase
MANYGKGLRWEYAVRDFYKQQGAQVIRSAGSKGKVDLLAWAIDSKGEAIVDLIQCKKEKRKNSYKDDIAELSKVPIGNGWQRLMWVKGKKDIKIYKVEDGNATLKHTIEERSLR